MVYDMEIRDTKYHCRGIYKVTNGIKKECKSCILKIGACTLIELGHISVITNLEQPTEIYILYLDDYKEFRDKFKKETEREIKGKVLEIILMLKKEFFEIQEQDYKQIAYSVIDYINISDPVLQNILITQYGITDTIIFIENVIKDIKEEQKQRLKTIVAIFITKLNEAYEKNEPLKEILDEEKSATITCERNNIVYYYSYEIKELYNRLTENFVPQKKGETTFISGKNVNRLEVYNGMQYKGTKGIVAGEPIDQLTVKGIEFLVMISDENKESRALIIITRKESTNETLSYLLTFETLAEQNYYIDLLIDKRDEARANIVIEYHEKYKKDLSNKEILNLINSQKFFKGAKITEEVFENVLYNHYKIYELENI